MKVSYTIGMIRKIYMEDTHAEIVIVHKNKRRSIEIPLLAVRYYDDAFKEKQLVECVHVEEAPIMIKIGDRELYFD